MKVNVTLLHVVALLALAGSTRGDDVTPPGCTVTPDESQGMHVKINEMAISCLAVDRATIDQINEIHTLESHKTFFKNFCDKKQEVRECLAGVTHNSEVCDNETGHRFFLIFRELLETVLDSGCVQDGEILAKMFLAYNISENPSFESDHFHNCMNTALGRIVRSISTEMEPHSRLFIMYRELVNSKECFGKINEGDVTLMKAIESILGDVADKMKCMHPQDETAVLCKTIDVSLPDVPRICPMTTLDEEKHALVEILLERMSLCLSLTFLDEQSLNLIDTLETSMKFIVHNCGKKEAINKCLSEVVTLSSVCLNEAQHNSVKLFDDVIKHGLDSLCIIDGGEGAAYLLHKTLSKTDATLQHNDVRDCMTLARPQQEGPKCHIDAADFLRYHQELKVFKACLVDQMHGDNKAVFDIHLLISSLQRNMKCLDPEHGTMVLCETIDTTPSTEVKVCPLVGGHGNETTKYEKTMVHLAMSCLRAGTQELDSVRKFTTLEQFQTFFKSFCHNRPAVNHCLVDVTAIAGMCLSNTDHQMLTIFTDFYGNVLESGCEQDGEIFSTIMNGIMVDSDDGIDIDEWKTCANASAAEFKNHINETVAKTSEFHYHLFVNFTQCVLNGTSDAGTFKTVFTTFTNELRKDFKCIRPDDGTIAICESFVNHTQ